MLFTERNVDDIIPVVKKVKEAGAEILLGNVEKAGPTLLKPHILLGVKPETILWQRESFGPVPALTAVDTVDEVVELDSILKIDFMMNRTSRSRVLLFRGSSGYSMADSTLTASQTGAQ